MRRGEKPVLISIYVMGPSRRSSSQHGYHVARRRTSNAKGCGGGGYDRKAELLLYSQKLRALARSQPQPAGRPRPSSQHHEKKITPVECKRKSSRILTTVSNCKRVLQEKKEDRNKRKIIQRIGDKVNAIARRLTANRKRFVSKLLRPLPRQRS